MKYIKDSTSHTTKLGRRSTTTVTNTFTDKDSGDSYSTINTTSRFNKDGLVGGIAALVFMILFAGTLFRLLATDSGASLNYLSFEGLLNALQSVPSIDITWISKLDPNTWGISLPNSLQFLQTLLSGLMGIVQILSFIFVGIGQALLFIGYLLGFILGF